LNVYLQDRQLGLFYSLEAFRASYNNFGTF
jgi:hypothetical protein